MEAIPIALQIGGQLLGGIAANKAGKANQRALEARAREEENAGAAQELRVRTEARKAIGAQAAAQWSNGFAGDSGSTLDALAESQVNMMVDVLQVRRDAAARARQLREEGQVQAAQGRNGLLESMFGAASAFAGYKSDWAGARAPYAGGGGSVSPYRTPPIYADPNAIVVTRGR